MKTFRVAICYEEGFTVQVKAEDEIDAEEIAHSLAEKYGTDVPKEYLPDTVHRDYFTQDAEEVTPQTG
jgi:capsular polysaccharide biosynthesis protein